MSARRKISFETGQTLTSGSFSPEVPLGPPSALRYIALHKSYPV